jgi:hypothetical protein
LLLAWIQARVGAVHILPNPALGDNRDTSSNVGQRTAAVLSQLPSARSGVFHQPTFNGQCVAPRSYDADTLCPVDDLTLLCDVVAGVDVVVVVPCSEQEAMNAIAIMAPNKDNMDLFMVL